MITNIIIGAVVDSYAMQPEYKAENSLPTPQAAWYTMEHDAGWLVPCDDIRGSVDDLIAGFTGTLSAESESAEC